ncbi:MAG: hypothetical protein R3A51_13055 [Nannocystaceae bacterium]|nr:hypothetical protein [Myxococcales bacterium]
MRRIARYTLSLSLSLSLVTVACGDESPADTDTDGGTATESDTTDGTDTDGDDPVAAALDAKAGTYMGSWELFGYDPMAGAYPAFAWTDVVTAQNPTVEADRAYLDVTDVITFEMGGGYEQMWIEGFQLNEDGTPGAEFIEMMGVVTVLEEVEPDHYVYEQPVTEQDLMLIAGVTLENLVSGTHVVDKVVTHPGGVETHTISRTTSIEYTDDADQLVTIEFESLRGTHEKTE